MNKEVREKRSEFLVATLSNGIQVDPDSSIREEFKRKLGVQTLFYPDRRIKALGGREHFPVLNLAPNMQNYAEKHQIYLHGFEGNLGGGHWNSEGHKLAGKLISSFICDSLSN